MGKIRGMWGFGRTRKTSAIEAHADQYPGAHADAEKRRVVMGLDFGTAFTKVVIADNRRAYAAVFNETGSDVSRYLLPSLVSIAGDGTASLDTRAKADRFADLKLRILNGDMGDDVIHATVAFLALVIRTARHQFMTMHRDEFGGDRLEWQLNIGLPADRCSNDRLTSFYRLLAASAWHASVLPGQITTQVAENCFALDDSPLDKGSIGLVPEFAAQVCGYVRSPMRQDGAHLLIDVGGGTLDVAVFNVYHDTDDSDLFPVLAGAVEPLGVLPMHQKRIAALEAEGLQVRRRAYAEKSMYTSAAKYFSVSVDSLKQADAPFREQVRSQILGVLERAKRDKYPMLYQQHVRVFLCGGGARVELYSRIVNSLVNAGHPCHLELSRLPRVERLDAEYVDDTVYDRLSVAYGLSFDSFDIGTVRLPHELDAGKPVADGTGIACPTCNGTGGRRGNNCTECGGSGWLS
jgi:hypothetical protein